VSFLVLGLAQDPPAEKPFDPAVHEATQSFKAEQFLVLPVRVHLLRCKEEDALNSKLQDPDVRRVFEKINRIWNRAGLAPSIESIVSEEAVRPAEFDAGDLQAFRTTRPAASRAAGMLHVYYVHHLPTNGVFMGRDAIFVKDTAALRPVRGGVDEPLPRVTSHEIGHAMGLVHRQDTINLLASGTSGWSINDAEIDTVRKWASQQDWVLSPSAALQKKHYEVLSRLPGESDIKEKAKAALKE